MDDHDSAELIRDKGFALLPKPHSKSPGHSGLLITMRAQPNQSGFDPVTLRVRLKDTESGLCRLNTLRHSNSCRDSRHICPGQLTLLDSLDSARDFFTFGGELECTRLRTDFIYQLSSPAPILALRGSGMSIPDQLAAETDAMIAEIESQWTADEDGFSLRLATVDPFSLYTSAIQSILTHYHKSKSLMETFRDFSDALHWERDWLHQNHLWPTNVPPVDDLLGRPQA